VQKLHGVRPHTKKLILGVRIFKTLDITESFFYNEL